jgi:hypothetical protein
LEITLLWTRRLINVCGRRLYRHTHLNIWDLLGKDIP